MRRQPHQESAELCDEPAQYAPPPGCWSDAPAADGDVHVIDDAEQLLQVRGLVLPIRRCEHDQWMLCGVERRA